MSANYVLTFVDGVATNDSVSFHELTSTVAGVSDVLSVSLGVNSLDLSFAEDSDVLLELVCVTATGLRSVPRSHSFRTPSSVVPPVALVSAPTGFGLSFSGFSA